MVIFPPGLVEMDRNKLTLDLPKVIIAPPPDSHWSVFPARVKLELGGRAAACKDQQHLYCNGFILFLCTNYNIMTTNIIYHLYCLFQVCELLILTLSNKWAPFQAWVDIAVIVILYCGVASSSKK